MRVFNRRFCEVPLLGAVVSLGAVTGLVRAQDATAVGSEKAVVVRAEDSGKSAGKRPNRRLMREGTFFSDRQGWLKPVGAERWAMVWDAVLDPKTGAMTVDPPMAVLPCLKLMEMRRIVEARPETVTFRVSGRVLVYKGRNYLLPTFFMTLAESAGGKPGAGTSELSDEARNEARLAFDDMMGRSGAPGEPGGESESNDPDAILRGIDKATPNVSIPVAPSGADGGNGANGNSTRVPVSGDAMQTDQRWKLVREGTMLTARRGRLLRGPLGEFVFAPDNGTGTDRSTRKRADNAMAAPKGSKEPAAAPSPTPTPMAASETDTMLLGPMRIIPCLNLQEMERLTQTHAVALEFKVSGQVFVYDGRNYLLPTMYLIEADRDGNVTAGQ